jgi:hypothetical protein
MARGFESKAVAEQQEAAESHRRESEDVAVEPGRLARKRTLELSRLDIRHRLSTAQAEAHRRMLERALAALDAEIAALE